MSNQKSFSFSYKLKNTSEKDVTFDAHVNVWNVSDRKSNPFIDFGLLIHNYKLVESICFTAPFEVADSDIIDLSKRLQQKEIQLIFNNSNYIYKEINRVYTGYERENNDTVLILPIKTDKGNLLKYCQYESINDENLMLQIVFSSLNDIPKDIDSIYIRFRIQNIASQRLLSTLANKNNYLESAFIERQILDFKLNNVRTMNQYALSALQNQGYDLTRFESIHLFVMVPSDFEVSIWGNFSECRQLETDEWNSYLKGNISESTKDILAYHWKEKMDSIKQKKVDEFAQLIKIEHKSTNFLMIFLYCLIVIVLGGLGSASFEALKCLIKSVISLITSITI